MKFRYLVIFLLIFLVSCKDKTKTVIEETYDNGSPKTVKEYILKNNQEILASEKGFYPDSSVMFEGKYAEGTRTGQWTYFYEDGKPWAQGVYENGKENGLYTTWFENGNKRYEGNYKNGERTGVWTFWKFDGTVDQKIDYK